MSTNTHESFRAMYWSRRVCKFLLVAEHANETFVNRHPETYGVCGKAIQQCWEWLGDRAIAPETLANYLDADETENPWMQESVFKDDSHGLNALVLITMVVGHVAHLAYKQAGRSQFMSEVIVEAGESAIELIQDYGKPFGIVQI